MRATPLAAVAALFLAALCAFAPQPASAQGRDTVYAVSGIRVDETAANASDAQQAGFTAAQRAGLERLVRRLTLPDELSRLGVPTVDSTALERLVSSVDVEEERRSATRYIGRLSVRFDANGVRALLRSANLTIVDTRTSPVLVAATVAPDTTPETAALWRQVWAEGGYAHELVPLQVAPQTLQGGPDWAAAAPFAQASAAASALYATLRVQGSTATATLTDVSATGQRSRGQISARIAGGDTASLRAALALLADQANAGLQDEWKARNAATPGQRGRISASALYTSQAQWERIKQGLESAAQTLISEIRIEAVGREGALVSFSFVGDRAQLATELGRRGLRLEDSPNGPVLRVAGR